MSDRSAIEWTDASWNPIRARCWEMQDDGSGKERIGWHCEHVSEGCRNCYAERINLRLGTGFEFKPGVLRGKPGYHGGGVENPELFLDEDMLTLPLRWKKPRRIFVCSMTDLFADFVKDEWIDKMFAVMALCPQHTFQVLTKRAERMRDYFATWPMDRKAPDRITELACNVAWSVKRGHQGNCGICERPLPNIWCGVSCERQEEADARIPHLLATPAAKRFVSLEPLLGPISLKRIRVADHGWLTERDGWQDVLEGWRDCKDYPGREELLDWVIVGGESGPHARPMHPWWVRSLRAQCQAANVPFFFKQWGGWIPDHFRDDPARQSFQHNQWFTRVGKKAAGRLLDGREWNEFPAVRS
jgi:protein gp37